MIQEHRTIYIVIPVHNRLEATRECLESLSCQTYTDFRIIIVDDGSTDSTSEIIEKTCPDVKVLRGDGNLWWTGATNLGVRHALQVCRDDDYILTLNNDTVLPSDYLEGLMSLAEHAPNALIGSIARDYSRPDTRVDEGIKIHWVSAKFKKIKLTQETGEDRFYEVSALPGRGTLIPVRVFRTVGLYDQTSFPHYAADYDFSLRASKIGYELVLHPRCYLYTKTHLTGISNVYNKISFAACIESFYSIKSPTNLKTRIRFGLKHSPLIYRPSFVICDLIRVLIATFRNQIANLARE